MNCVDISRLNLGTGSFNLRLKISDFVSFGLCVDRQSLAKFNDYDTGHDLGQWSDLRRRFDVKSWMDLSWTVLFPPGALEFRSFQRRKLTYVLENFIYDISCCRDIFRRRVNMVLSYILDWTFILNRFYLLTQRLFDSQLWYFARSLCFLSILSLFPHRFTWSWLSLCALRL